MRGDHHHWQWQRVAQAWRLLAALFAPAPASLLVVGCPAPDCPGPDCLAADCSAARFQRLAAPAWRSAAEIAMPGRAASRPKSTAATAWNQTAAFAAATAAVGAPVPVPAYRQTDPVSRRR